MKYKEQDIDLDQELEIKKFQREARKLERLIARADDELLAYTLNHILREMDKRNKLLDKNKSI